MRKIPTAALLLFLTVRLSAMAPEQPSDATVADPSVSSLQAQLGPDFRLHETDHFAILYDTPYATLRPLTARLEGIYDAIERFCSPFTFTARKPDTRLTIILFARYERFMEYSKSADLPVSGVAGFYDPRTNVAAFADVENTPSLGPLHSELQRLQSMLHDKTDPSATPANRLQIENRILALRAERDSLADTFNRLVLQHEAAHQVLFNLGLHVRGTPVPLWLAEGLACQFEVPQTDQNGSLKRVNQLRLGDFREALGPTPTASKAIGLFKVGVEQGRLLSLPDLVAAEGFEGEQSAVAARYAQSWALVYYLHQQKPQLFAMYLEKLARRSGGENITMQSELDEFQDVFGPLDDEFTQGWLRFVLRLRYDRTAGKG